MVAVRQVGPVASIGALVGLAVGALARTAP
jgi:hypothetical protein